MSLHRRLPTAAARLAALVAIAVTVVACGSGPTPAPSSVTPPPATPATSAHTPGTTPIEQGPPTVGPSDAPSSSPSPSATPVDPIALFQKIGDQTAAVRQLDWKTPIEPKLIDEAELRRMMEKDLDTQMPAAMFEKTEALYRGLGLMTGDRHLRDLYLDAMGAQVLGFYRDTDKTLYVVQRSDGIGPVEEYTVSHEATHALQDQNFGIGTLHVDEPDQGDRSIAKLALVEGDATLASFQWMQTHLTLTDLAEIVKAGLDPAPQAALDALPPIARIGLTFPYETGLTFVMAAQQAGGWDAVDAMWKDPPVSTEQLLHPEKYKAHEMPVDVALPTGLAESLGAGWSLAMQDTFGELGLRTWLAQANEKAAAERAATGWGGDRVGLYRGPDGAWAIVLRTVWDDWDAAQGFTTAAGKVVATLPHAAIAVDRDGPVVLVGSDAAIVKRLRSIVVGS